MGAAKQLSLIPKRREEIEFGGAFAKGKRKSKRPISLQRPMHLVLKSTQARGKFALNPSHQKIQNLIFKMAERFHIKIYSVALNWSHAHLVIQVKNRSNYNSFIRALTGAMVLLLRAPKGFFDLKPYTKIGTWGKQLRNWVNYSIKNQLQARGLLKSTADFSNNTSRRGNRYGSRSLDYPERPLRVLA